MHAMPRHSISIAQSYPVFKFSRFSPETPCGLILYYILSVQETMFFCTGFLLCLCKYRIFVRDISHFPFFFCMIPYSFILLYSVVRLTPSSPAAVSRLPPVCTSARIMRSFSSFPSFSRKDGVVCKDGYSSSLSAPTVSPSVSSTAEVTACFSSLTFPAHARVRSIFSAFLSKPSVCRPSSLLASSRKKFGIYDDLQENM